jgi:hypothetical protein
MLVASDKCLEQNVSRTEKRRKKNEWDEYCVQNKGIRRYSPHKEIIQEGN